MCNNSNVCLAVKKELSHAELRWVERELCKLYDPFSIINSAHVLMSECHFASFDTFCGLQKIPQKKSKSTYTQSKKETHYTNMAETKDSLLIGKFYAIIKLFSLFPGVFFVCPVDILSLRKHTIRSNLQMEVEVLKPNQRWPKRSGRNCNWDVPNSCVTKVKMKMHSGRKGWLDG